MCLTKRVEVPGSDYINANFINVNSVYKCHSSKSQNTLVSLISISRRKLLTPDNY